MRQPVILSFAQVLSQLDEGGTVREAQEALAAVAQAVLDTGKAGSVTIKLNLKRDGDGSNQRITVTDSVTKALPTRTKGLSIFYVAEEGALTRDNPAQPSFDDMPRER
jgi:rhamnogalacturonyl hydrolase YesR